MTFTDKDRIILGAELCDHCEDFTVHEMVCIGGGSVWPEIDNEDGTNPQGVFVYTDWELRCKNCGTIFTSTEVFKPPYEVR